MKQSVYIETTIPSLLAARPSNNMTNQYRQNLTWQWWDNKRNDFNLFTSDYTWDECKKGDVNAAKRRIEFLNDIQRLPITNELEALSYEYLKLLSIPERSKVDALHLSICVLNQIDYLLSWNCTHLGVIAFKKITTYNIGKGLFVPILATPEAFIKIGGIDDEN